MGNKPKYSIALDAARQAREACATLQPGCSVAIPIPVRGFSRGAARSYICTVAQQMFGAGGYSVDSRADRTHCLVTRKEKADAHETRLD